MISKKIRVFLILLMVSLAVSLSGCNLFMDKIEIRRVDTHEEAGSSHVSIISVIPWAEFKDNLQPTFKLTETQALEAVVPTTSALEEKFLDSFQAAVKLSTPTTTENRTITRNLDQGVVSEETDAATVEEKSGDISSLETPASIAAGRKASDLPPAADKSVLNTKLSMDPMMKYWAATALYQEVQLLNRYIKSAAIDQNKYDPYVVRLQVSLQPQARYQPYDAYTTFSFFPDNSKSNINSSGQAIIPKFMEETDHCCPQNSATGKQGSGESTGSTQKQWELPKIIPLLVTDNLEAMMHSRSVNELRQFAFDLLFMIQGIQGNFNAQRYTEDLQTLIGRDLNSLLSTSRITDNSLRVRLGAMHQGGIHYSMVPRNHNISILLLVPKENPHKSMSITARTQFIDAIKGEELPGRTHRKINKKYKVIHKFYEFDKYCEFDYPEYSSLEKLGMLVEENRYQEFYDALKKCVIDPKTNWTLATYSQQIWVEFLALEIGSQYTQFSFPIPDIPTKTPALFPQQAILVLDDGKSGASVTLRGGKNLSTEKLAAILYVKDPNRGVIGSQGPDCSTDDFDPLANGYAPLIVKKVNLTAGGKEAVFTFDSPALWKLKDTKQIGVSDIRLVVTHPKTTRLCLGENNSASYLIKSTPAKTQFNLSTSAPGISVLEGNQGSLQVSVNLDGAKKVTVSVTGAEILDVPNSASNSAFSFSTDSRNLVFIKNGTADLVLKNLRPGQSVTLTGKSDLGTRMEKEIEVFVGQVAKNS